MQLLGPPEAPANGSREEGHSRPAGVGTTLLYYCSCEAVFEAGPQTGPVCEDWLALMESGSCVSAGWHGFASAFLYKHFLKHLSYYSLHRRQERNNIKMNKEQKKIILTNMQQVAARSEVLIHLLLEEWCKLLLANPPGRPHVST